MSIIRTLAIAKAAGGGGGGGDITTQSLSVSANGQYVAPSGKAYTPVNVDVTPTLQQKTATENGVVTPDTGYDGLSQVTVNVSGGGGGSVPEKDVNFYDYDGTCVAAYTATEFAALSAMAANPDHTSEGLTAQGWNWSLAGAKAYVSDNGMLNVGQMYITTDGKTHIHIRLEKGRTSPMLGVCPNGTVDVDWGDGSAHDTLTGTSDTTVQWTPTHNYATPGGYVIKLTVTGSMGFYGSSSMNQHSGLLRYSSSSDSRNKGYQNAVQFVHVGSGVTSIGNYAFYDCHSLASITIPDSVTSIGSNAFTACYSLASINIPSGVTSIAGNALSTCYGLASITIPSGVTSIGSSALSSCYSLAEIHFLSVTPPTVSNSSAFSNVPTDCKIYVPTGSLSAYTSANNYPSSSTYTYIEE